MHLTKPHRATHSYRQRLHASPARVFPLLCPVRETEWAEGWQPELVITSSGVVERDCVFVTPEKLGKAIWYVTRHEPETWFAEMLRILPGVTACRITIQLIEDGEGCLADITYSHTSLSSAGDEFVSAYTADFYHVFMQTWECELNRFLGAGAGLPRKTTIIGLIGDRDDSVPAHRAIPTALRQAAESVGIDLQFEWVSTCQITSTARLAGFNGLWCVPASPYRSMDGALLAIRHARENGVPFLGTCGGFQHAVLEYARNVLGWPDADHAETAPGSGRAVIAPLECALVEKTQTVRLYSGSRIATACGVGSTIGEYHCRFGLNPRFRAQLTSGPLRVTADDATGDARAIELDGHPFFVATLFQPERAALGGERVPLAEAFVRACMAGDDHFGSSPSSPSLDQATPSAPVDFDTRN